MKGLITALMLVSAVVINAATVSTGLIGGINIANMSLLDDNGSSISPAPDSKVGFIGGGFIDIGINNMFSVVPGLEFNMRGMSMEQSMDDGMGNTLTSKAVADFNYFSIPVSLKAAFGTGKLRPFLIVGPELGFLLSAKVKETVSGGGLSIDTTADVKDQMNSTDFGLNFGAGAEMDAGNCYPFILAKYYLGLTNIEKDPVSDSSTKNKGFVIQVGVRFK